MSFEYSLHQIEAMRMKRIHAGTGERASVRVWEIKPRVRTEAEAKADNQSLLGLSAGILKRAIARGTVKIAMEITEKIPAGKRLLPGERVKISNADSVRRKREEYLAKGLTVLGTIRKRSPNGTRKIYTRTKEVA